MLKARDNILKIIAPALVGKEAENQREIDETMIKLDGSDNKSNLGGNAILAVSMAVARAAATESGMPLYKYLRQSFRNNFV